MGQQMKVILLMATTADGMIARDSDDLVNWTGKADKKYFVQVTKESGVMIMGSRTFDTIGTVLPDRKNVVMTRNKKRISTDDNLVFTDQAPEEILQELEKQGYSTITLIGGALINSVFINAGLIDEIYMTIVPRIFGEGLSLFKGVLDVNLELLDVIRLDQSHILLKYRVIHL